MAKVKFQVAFTGDFLNEDGDLAYGDVGLQTLDASPLVDYYFLDTNVEVVTPEQIANLDGLIVHDSYVVADTFAVGAQRLIVIARLGTGYDRINVAACTNADVALINTPDIMHLPTASAALTLILALSKRLVELDRLVRKRQWNLRLETQGFELRGRTLGIVGFGGIGRELVRLVAPFNMHLLAYDPYIDPEYARRLNVEMVEFEYLLCESDFVSLHCLLTDETRGMIGNREFNLMKPTAYLINLARGPIVDHEALVNALRERRIAGAGIDVFHQEPVLDDDPLLHLPNVVLSPHWLGNTKEVFYEGGLACCEAMLHAASGRLPINIVNKEVKDKLGFQAKLARFQS